MNDYLRSTRLRPRLALRLLVLLLLVSGCGKTQPSEPTASPAAPSPTLTSARALPETHPTAAPVHSPTLTPTPQVQFLLWSRRSPAVYMYAHSGVGGQAVALLENGAHLLLLERQTQGGRGWARVACPDGQTGWLAGELLYPSPASGHLARITGDQGAYLRAAPAGRVLDWLTPGAPVILDGQSEEAWGRLWTPVLLLDGRSGWAARDHLLEQP